MPYTIGTMLPPNLSPVTFQLAARADPTNFLATVYTATPRASLTTQYEFSVSVSSGDYLVKQLQAPFASGYVRLSGTSDVLHFDSLDDLIRHEMQTAEHDATQAAIIGLGGSLTVVRYSPVAESGQIDEPIIIGDDYLAAYGLAFAWEINEVFGLDAGDASCFFGGKKDSDNAWLVEGTVTENNDGTWSLSFDLTKEDTANLEAGCYEWSVEVRDANGKEMTRIASDQKAVLKEKQT